MIEDNPDRKVQSKRKFIAPVAVGSKTFSPAQLKRFFGNLPGNSWVCTHSMGSIKTHNCCNGQKICHPFFPDESFSVERFSGIHHLCGTHAIVCCSSIFKIDLMAGLVNTATDFISRLEQKFTEKINLKKREDAQATPNTHRVNNSFLICCR